MNSVSNSMSLSVLDNQDFEEVVESKVVVSDDNDEDEDVEE